MERIRLKDYTLWKPAPKEIADRLGWLDSPPEMGRSLAGIEEFVNAVRADGYTFALLMGMGGSSLAPEVFRRIFGRADGFLDLAVLDSTDPGAVLDRAEGLDMKRTLFIVSTKSGGTVETFSFLKYFFNLAAGRLGADEAGRHFIAITDPGSALAEIAVTHRFRHCFLNDPTIGGRYSALSFFGLVPAALIGMDVEGFLGRAAAAAEGEFTPPDAGGEDERGLFRRPSGGTGDARAGQAHPPFLAGDRPLRRLGRAAHRGEHREGGEGDPAGCGRAPRAAFGLRRRPRFRCYPRRGGPDG